MDDNDYKVLFSNTVPIDIIKGIKFTSRQVDVLACLFRGKTAKKIAFILAIQPSTVKNCIREIMIRIDCNSTDSIKDFLESSDAVFFLQNHYSDLVFQRTFAQDLKKILIPNSGEKRLCSLIYWVGEGQPPFFIAQLEKHLKFVGVTLTKEARKEICTLTLLIDEIAAPSKSFRLFVVPQSLKEALKNTKRVNGLKINYHLGEESNTLDTILTLFVGNTGKIPISFSGAPADGRQEQENYYLSLVKILKLLFPTHNFEDLISKIMKYYQGAPDTDSPNQWEKTAVGPKEKIIKSATTHVLKNKKLQFSFSILFFITVFSFFTSMFFKQEKRTEITVQQMENSIRSDLLLPVESAFLNRSELIAQLDNGFKGKQGIQTVALVGIGGSGKTTLARQYATQQKENIIWEINAETKESIKESFELLVHALAETERDKQILREIQKIKNPTIRAEEIRQLVKKKLSLQSNWFLIYDNVEKYTDLEGYLPRDLSTWGKGKIILTTRDSNIQSNKHVNSVIQIGELDQNKKLSFFIKIMSNGKASAFSSLQIEEAKKFLENIPSFPLDISVAAYYLKTTNIPYHNYLEYLKQQDENFIIVQENLLKETGEYAKTRHSIITLSLKHLMDTHNDFGDLLLFISLLDFQHIPRELLSHYKKDSVVDNFIYHLKKYSLITNVSSVPSIGSVLSIHRSTQAIILSYLRQILDLENHKELISIFSRILEKHIGDAIDTEDYLKMKLLEHHCEKFLTHSDLLTDLIKSSLGSELGGLYYYLDDFQKTRDILNESIKIYNKLYPKNFMGLARALSYLGNTFRRLGDYEKAKELFEKSLTIYKEHFSEHHICYARTLAYLGVVHKELGNYKKAHNFLEKSLIIYNQYFPENFVAIAWSLAYLGVVYGELGNFEQAKETLEQSLLIHKKHLSETHVDVAWILTSLGNIYMAVGKYEKAKELLERSLVAHKKYFSENHLDFAWALAYLGNVHRELGNFTKAKELLEQSLIIYKKHSLENHVEVGRVLAYLGGVHRELGDFTKAKELFEQSLIIYRKHFAENHIEIARVLREMAHTYLLMEDMTTAENLLNQSLKIFQAKQRPEEYTCFENLAVLALKKSMSSEDEETFQHSKIFKTQAIVYLQKALAIVKTHFPKDSPHIIRIQSKIDKLEEEG